MSPPPPRFSVGVNYWPYRPDVDMVAPFDAGEIRDDFAHIAALGLDAVRFFVRWDELQPAADRIDVPTLDRVASIVALAAEAGLRVLPTLCGRLGDRDFMPAWAASLRDLYRGPLLDAQVRIATAIGERLRGAANVVAWDLGHAFTRVREPRGGSISTGDHGSAPAAEPDVAEWGRVLAKTLRDAGIGVTAGAADGDLTADTHVRFGSLCASFAFASIQGSNVTLPFARSRLDPDAVPFLAMLTSAFSFKPVLVTAIGNPAPASDAEIAAYAAVVLDRLHTAGRLGAYWWCWAEVREKPVADALAAFAREGRTVVKAHDMPMISSTYYYRTLPVSANTLYDAYLAAAT